MSDWANAAANIANGTYHNKTKTTSTPAVQTKPTTQNGAPNISSASAKAALLAHKAAITNQRDTHLSESAAQESIKEARDRALLAATKANRERSIPEKPTPALSQAASKDAELASRRIAARQQEAQERHDNKRDIIHIKPEMLTEHPPIRMEIDEKRHNEALHASAISLAKTVYNPKANHHNGEPTAKDQAKGYVSLQDAAQKLAAQKLAKINEDNKNLPVRSKSTRTNRTTGVLQKIRRGRHRRASDGESDIQVADVRKRMSSLRSQIDDVDRKREQEAERSRLMLLAEKKVQAQMHTLDATVFATTGKMSPAMMEDWEAQARARRAQVNSNQVLHMRQTKPDSAVDVGAGKLVDRSEIQLLAEERVGPTLKGIDEAVERRKIEEQEKKERIEEEKRFLKEEREKRRSAKAEQKRAEQEELEAQRARDKQMKAGAAIATLVQPSSIREREEFDAEKTRLDRAKAAAALEGIVQTEQDREQQEKEKKLRAAQTLEQIAHGSPKQNTPERNVEGQRVRAGSTVQEIVDAEIQRELRDKEQKVKAAKTLEAISQGEALFAAEKKQKKEKKEPKEKRSSFSLLRKKSKHAPEEPKPAPVVVTKLPEIKPGTPLDEEVNPIAESTVWQRQALAEPETTALTVPVSGQQNSYIPDYKHEENDSLYAPPSTQPQAQQQRIDTTMSAVVAAETVRSISQDRQNISSPASQAANNEPEKHKRSIWQRLRGKHDQQESSEQRIEPKKNQERSDTAVVGQYHDFEKPPTMAEEQTDVEPKPQLLEPAKPVQNLEVAEEKPHMPKAAAQTYEPRSSVSKDEKQETKEPKEPKHSRLKSAFDRLKRRSNANVIVRKDHQEEHEKVHVPALTPLPREDGDSTELEDSSDGISFHSTTDSPEAHQTEFPVAVHGEHDMTNKSIPEPPIVSITAPESKPVTVPGDDEAEFDESEWAGFSDKPGDRLSGRHLPTKFHEEL